MVKKQTLFFKAKDPRLARIISTTSPTAFRRSIRTLKKGGLTIKERQALVVAQNRSGAQLKRKNLSPKERCQFSEIVKIKIPQANRKPIKKKRK